jgi:hypothetical protein
LSSKHKLIRAQKPFDYAVWEEKLIDYIIASNQPFTEVESEEFIDFIQYTHQNTTNLKLPSATTVQRRVFKMSEKTIDELRAVFKVRACYRLLEPQL